ncbi:hypothetical protein ACH0BY_11260 [Paenibacillus amylolyticus]|uniref:hypothetical protein n=1 Tax=Paenibacillus amylolyticus TaxID=1451 RepID=UPI00387A79E7
MGSLYWQLPTPENREACRDSLSPETIRDFQYLHGADASLVSPDGYTLDIAYMSRPEAEEIQLDLILDYRTNVDRYPDFQAYFRKYQPALLAVWGKNDPAFLPAGAKAYKRDITSAEIHKNLFVYMCSLILFQFLYFNPMESIPYLVPSPFHPLRYEQNSNHLVQTLL